ncbi:hypothetical protein H4582DRAFT_2125919, partial [Lactarius indigo]
MVNLDTLPGPAPDPFPEYFPPTDMDTSGITVDPQVATMWQTPGIIDMTNIADPHAVPHRGGVRKNSRTQTRSTSQIRVKNAQASVDLADEVKGMYRVLDLINESGSNGYVDKIVIAQEPLQRFINAMSPGAYASITKVDFKTLDQLSIKPIGIYGCKDEIVRLLQSLGAVNEELAELLLAPSHVGGRQRKLSSGLYIVMATDADPTDERHYIIYWPEDSTWNDSAPPPLCRNRVTFMRYLTKMCDQVVALLSADHSASIVWNDEDGDTDSIDIDAGDSERLFAFEVAKTNEQEESAVSRPGFQMNSGVIVPCEALPEYYIDTSLSAPRLLPGETVQGLLTAVYVPPQVKTETWSKRSYSPMALSQLLKENTLVLSEGLDENAVKNLVDVALRDLFPRQCEEWHGINQYIHEIFMREQREKKSAIVRDIASTQNNLQHALREEVVNHVIGCFPSLDRDGLSSHERVHSAGFGVENPVKLSGIRALYPEFEGIFRKCVKDAKFDDVPRKSRDFRALKLGVISLWHLLEQNKRLRSETRSALFKALVNDHNFQQAFQVLPKKSIVTRIISSFSRSISWSIWSGADPKVEETFKNEMKQAAAQIPDSQFLQQLESTNEDDLRSAAQDAKAIAQSELLSSIDTVVEKMTHAILAMQQDTCGRSLHFQIANEEREVLNNALAEFIREINKQSVGVGRQNSTIHLDRIEVEKEKHYSPVFKLTGRREEPEEHRMPEIKLWVHLMELTSDDRHNMQMDPKHIPTLTINDRLSSSFHVPHWAELIFYRLLENEKLLLVLANQEKFFIFLEPLRVLDPALRRGKYIKSLDRGRLGQSALFSFDEAKRILAVCASTKLQLHMLIFDETYKTLQAQGSATDLIPWYGQAESSILHMASVCGREEVALVDSNSRVRIFSFVTLQFRPASIQLQTPPNAIYSSPDGSCLLILHTHDSGPSLTVYHLETFGSTEGIALDVPDFPLEGAVLTSVVSRGQVFFLGLDNNAQAVKSVAIDITKKVTEFVFKEKGNKHGPNTHLTQHNCLLDCHADVWTRFPVLPAVKRRTITSLSERQQKMLTFIADDHTRPFSSYFSDLIQKFAKAMRKPTGDELSGIKVTAAQFRPFWDKVLSQSDWKVSRYRVGEWLVDLLCLIPIHIAVCRENRFVPLADGVLSAELERSLLGAEVNQIVDKLSFGWYESIFQSYLALKPVKVVSSMGQQSVGKSYSLNHLVDTSFAGSAMRTTEGVWMSVTPTDEALIVALDFEGVDSIERSPQEDTLLVLFNTAISNLVSKSYCNGASFSDCPQVLFRNNFAFGRDISGLFQSFQSSASVLDPAANPTLFQSTLVIIIKDVLEPDTVEISREFSLKFQQIVQQEQDANFISRLHGGKLDIIPFPVIKSREFYKLFATLKRRLDLQKISHPAAGEFLYTIKTLMAKLKAETYDIHRQANDWGALSHTMAEHRAKSLSAFLSIALATGYSEIEPELEPLKNFDSDLRVECDDTGARFAISDRELPLPEEIEMCLSTLRESQSPGTPRQFIPDSEWVGELASHLSGLIDLRVNHVRLWLDSNLGRFQGGHAAIEDLRRRFDSLVIEMKANVQLCRAQCASCHLLCIRSRLHDGDHGCQTSHKCARTCEFCKDSTKSCSLAAGHPGKHVCIVSVHLCGDPCKLLGRRGCLEDCTKVIGHEDEHMCSALAHMCSEPCALRNVQLLGGKTFSCQESCSIPSEQEHESHSCDTRLCPVTCELCKRLCDQPHLHGLTPGAHHLCGEAHSCLERCAVPGICQIDTSPQSIEATFTGRHETFQYTRYTQVATRMQCAQTIPPGLLSHEGEHIHSKEEKSFHFCETRCKNCGYFCTLPLGHTQQEHETSHGSMTETRWAVDGPDDASLELGGHKFSSNDEGAPMMCNLVCSSMGRHIHIDYCRADVNGPCDVAEVQHINDRIVPEPDKPKDAVTHSLYWQRMGFKGHFSSEFAKICAETYNQTHTPATNKPSLGNGPEHLATETAPGQPSYCMLPMFHLPHSADDPADGVGYVSHDGHKFSCENPGVVQQAFHVIFVIDRSSSMSSDDRLPLSDAPATDLIVQKASNRLGAVYSALYSFWSARHVAVTSGQETTGTRRDAYSVIMFNHAAKKVVVNDFTSSPDELLDIVLNTRAGGATNFTRALQAGQAVMVDNWSTERTPIMIFLSDGECSIPDTAIQDLCRSAIQHRKPLSFHAVSFGEEWDSTIFDSTRPFIPDPSISYQNSSASTLRKMAQLALKIQNEAPHDPMFPVTARIPSSFTTALDTVRLAETFLRIAESLRKTRGLRIRGGEIALRTSESATNEDVGRGSKEMRLGDVDGFQPVVQVLLLCHLIGTPQGQLQAYRDDLVPQGDQNPSQTCMRQRAPSRRDILSFLELEITLIASKSVPPIEKAVSIEETSAFLLPAQGTYSRGPRLAINSVLENDGGNYFCTVHKRERAKCRLGRMEQELAGKVTTTGQETDSEDKTPSGCTCHGQVAARVTGTTPNTETNSLIKTRRTYGTSDL